jgi:hypothetical protein
MEVWEEGYVSTKLSYELMHTKGLWVLEGAPLRGEDGRIDRERVLRYVAGIAGSSGFFRLRLQRGVLGLTPPAWVPATDFDVRHHVVFADEVATLASPDLWRLAGDEDGVMPIDRPLWRFRFTELDNGDVAMGSMFHHASFDGQSGMRMSSGYTAKSSDEPAGDPADPFAGRRAPRAVELPGLAFAAWTERRRRGTASGPRKRLTRRIRRVGARILRPALDAVRSSPSRRARGLLERHTDWVQLDSRVVARRAGELGGTISDLLAAALIAANGSPDPVVNIRYPVSARAVGPNRPRNQVTDIELYGSAADEFPALVGSLHEQVAAIDPSHPFRDGERGRQIGYATLLPWVSSPRYFAGARIRAVIPFAAGLGTDDITAGAILYNGDLFIGVTMPLDRDVVTTTRRLADLLTGTTS